MSVSTNQLHYKLNFLVCRITKTSLTDLSRSIWENLDLDRGHRPSLRLVRTHNLGQDYVFPYRPPARSIRANSKTFHCKIMLNHVAPPEIANVTSDSWPAWGNPRHLPKSFFSFLLLFFLLNWKSKTCSGKLPRKRLYHRLCHSHIYISGCAHDWLSNNCFMDITPLIIVLASCRVLITFLCFFSMNLLLILVRQGLAVWFLAFVAVIWTGDCSLLSSIFLTRTKCFALFVSKR